MRFVIVLFMILSAWSAPVGAKEPPRKLYVVVYEVAVDQVGHVSDLKVVQINDPDLPGSNGGEVKMTLPAEYLGAAREFLSRKVYSPSAKPFYTFTLFDPSQPRRIEF